MSKDERFTWKTVYGWQTPAFLKVMNGLDKKNQQLKEENDQLKKKILEEIDLEVAYVNETYSDGRMSKEQHNGAIISLRQLREKFE